MKRAFWSGALVLCMSLVATPALADESLDYLKSRHEKLQSATGATANTMLDDMVDFQVITEEAFGAQYGDTDKNHWKTFTPAQKTELAGLLKQLVKKNYRENIDKTKAYKVDYHGEQDADNGDKRVQTLATKESTTARNARSNSFRIDYWMRTVNGQWRVVDIVTERSSLKKNYFEQFHRMLTNPAQGYSFVVSRLKERINAPTTG